MRGKSFKRIVTGWTGMMIFLALLPVTRSLAQPKTAVDPVLEAHILSTTVQIKSFVPKPGTQPSSGARPYIMAEGLGTLVNWQNETVMLTHNHWGTMLDEAEFVRMLDAQGNLDLELSGADFRLLIRYQDAGTMILTDPHCVASTCSPNLAKTGDSLDVTSGDTVVFVHQASDGSLGVELVSAKVVSHAQYKGQPVFKVHTLDGQPIISGDSGGGMWYKGQLVGNMWGRFTEQTGEAGYAACLPFSQ